MLKYHGFYVFLEGKSNPENASPMTENEEIVNTMAPKICTDTKLYLFETDELTGLNYIASIDKHLKPEEFEYVKFHQQCYDYIKSIVFCPQELKLYFDNYSKWRREGITIQTLETDPKTALMFNLVRFFLTATDFQSHFKNFDPQNSAEEKYERALAEKSLRDNPSKGRWLLRHSSLNRPVRDEEVQRLISLGIRYYAVSYIGDNYNILHALITFQAGKGWYCFSTWYTNFVDVLENTLSKLGLRFHGQISHYIDTETEKDRK